MIARIYSPAKTPTQSGKGRTGIWLLEFAPETARRIEPLMGYTSSTDMNAQVRMEFASEAEAIAWCNRNGVEYSVARPLPAKRRRMSYAENFAWNRKTPWTH